MAFATILEFRAWPTDSHWAILGLNLGTPWATVGPSLPQGHYGPNHWPSMDHDGPKLAQECCARHVLNYKKLRTPCSKLQKVKG
jgi:hypothetical protein